MNAKNKTLPRVLLLLCLFWAAPLGAQVQSSSRLDATVGETFAVSRSIDSTFHGWTIDRYDVRKLSLRKVVRPDTIGTFRFTFLPLEPGDATVELSRFLKTALTEEVREQHTVGVSIRSEPSPPSPGGAQPQPATPRPEPTTSPASPPREPEAPTPSDGNPRERARELMEIGQYDEARQLMREQMKTGPKSARQDWLERIARSYRQQEQHDRAIETWNQLIEEYPRGDQPRWLLELARDHRANDADDKAQLALLEIRHRFSRSPQWPTAMEMLADIALEANNIERARTILERARSVLKRGRNPHLTLRLARLYDEFTPVRDYRRAVQLYRQAARQLEESDSEAARNARKRAEYLMQNYVQFGTE